MKYIKLAGILALPLVLYIGYCIITLPDMNEAINRTRLPSTTILAENGNDKDYIERAARDRLGYVYANEEVFTAISGK